MVTQINLAVVVVALWNYLGDVVVSEVSITWLRGKLDQNLSPKSVLCVFSVLFRFFGVRVLKYVLRCFQLALFHTCPIYTNAYDSSN